MHYNFFRPHTSLNDMTPAMAAGIRFPFRNWKDVVEQPIEITSRIPIEPLDTVVERARKEPIITSMAGIRKR